MNTKQVIVIRKDLNMRKGKMCAQASQASMKVFFDRMSSHIASDGRRVTEMILPDLMYDWVNGIFTKIVVSVNSETELLEIYNQAKQRKIPCCLIRDSGLTEFNNIPTFTAVAIGPDDSDAIDVITGHLPLL
jgi:peptidyl-tRNA hydrolase, PTH2 family